VANALEKILKIVNMMQQHCSPERLDSEGDIPGLAAQLHADRITTYDFRTHFYGYARRIVHNELIGLLRRTKYDYPTGGSEDELMGLAYEIFFDDHSISVERQTRLSQLLRALFAALHVLTERRYLVVCHTLAARPQFWLALEIARVDVAPDIPPLTKDMDDERIGEKIGISANNVRVQRLNAYRQMRQANPELAELLLVLMDAHLIEWELEPTSDTP
jgi:RNA polymerase sigma factor (sigma-70 family)